MSLAAQPGIETHPASAEYRLCWVAAVVGAAAAPVVLMTSGMRVPAAQLAAFCALLGALLGAHLFYRTQRPNRTLSLVTGAMGLMIACSLTAGIVANAGLRLRFDRVDAAFAHADRMLGFDTAAVVLKFADIPWLAALMGLAYASIFPLSFATALVLGAMGREERAWEFTWAFGGGVVVAALISVFVPAVGIFAHAGLESLSGTRLPAGAGTYFLTAMETLRNGTDPVLDLTRLEGVVSFPSFHMVMALAVGFAFRGMRWIGWPMAVWCAAVAVSTVPIGGHYLFDVLGGLLVWAGCMALARPARLAAAVPAGRMLQANPG